MSISLICACKNRNEPLKISLTSWLLKKEITEIIIVDWSSDETLSSLTKLDKRIKVITVPNQKYFNQPQPLNLAASIATGDYILKVDCDYIFSPYYNFFKTYQIDENSFVSGNHNIKNYEYFNGESYVIDKDSMSLGEIGEYLNSHNPIFKYLIGLLFVSRDNFIKTGGYNENLGKYYAYEDDEIFHRLRVLGLSENKLSFNYNLLHIPHQDIRRTENFEGYDSQYLNNLKYNVKGETEEERKWNAEYLLSLQHTEENKKNTPLTDNYYIQPLTKWDIQQIDEQNYYAYKVMKKNKLENFPSVYYVSLEESVDRQQNLEKQFAEYGITPKAVISKRYSESDDEITGKFLDQMNGGTIGCAVSHIKAIRRWYEETDEDYGFFCEDDLSLETIQYWDFTWEEFIETIPEGSLYVQLLLIRDNYETFEIRKKLWDDWAATAYILTRDYAKLLIDSYCRGEKKFHLEIPGVNNYAVPLVENILFETIDKGGSAIPLFVEDVNFGTTFSPEEDKEVVNNQKGGHYEARETVLNYWKNKKQMKSFAVEKVEEKKEEPQDFTMNQIEYLLTQYTNDPENAENNLKIGAWYWNQKHTAPALSYFLRCAERAEDPNLVYEALLWSHFCYEIQGTRDLTARGLLQHAVYTLPNRPEAYYLLAKFHSKREQWTDAYVMATQGLNLTEKDMPPLKHDIGYAGEYSLLYEKAVSGWWWGKSDEAREILQYIQNNYDLNDNYHNIVVQKLNEYGGKKITEKQNKKTSDIFEIEYLNACNTPSDINENLHILYDIAKECGHVTEMGVRTGCSTRAFLNTDVILRSYDLEKDEIVSNLFEYAKKIGKDVEYFEVNVLDIEIEETDLLFIDTWHQYEQLDQELNKHSNKVRKYIAFHDTHTYALNGEKCSNTSSGNILTDFKENPYGILPCIIEFTIKNPEWKFKVYKTNNNGMTILEKKNI
jgi:GR25 family glycosyltransferase involved in LPS biosynthesis